MNGAVLYGLLSALVWGAGDFCGGLATRRARPFSVVLTAEISGAILLLLAALAWRQPLPSLQGIGWSAAAGTAGAIGLLGLYTALGSGHMGVVAPISAVIAALIPIVASAVLEGFPGSAQVVGFAVALVAVWLLSSGGERSVSARELRLALLAGLGFGFYFVLIDRADPGSGFWNLTFARTFAALVLVVLMVAIRHPLLPPRGAAAQRAERHARCRRQPVFCAGRPVRALGCCLRAGVALPRNHRAVGMACARRTPEPASDRWRCRRTAGYHSDRAVTQKAVASPCSSTCPNFSPCSSIH